MNNSANSNPKRQVIYGLVPSKSNSYKITSFKGHASMAKSTAMKKYEDSFYMQCNEYRNAMLDGYLKISIDVYYPNERSDLDGSAKAIMDCLQKVKAFKNDNKIVDIHMRKFLDKLNPRIEFELSKV